MKLKLEIEPDVKAERVKVNSLCIGFDFEQVNKCVQEVCVCDFGLGCCCC